MPKTSLKLVRTVLISVFIVTFSFSLGYLIGNNGFVASFKKYPKVQISRINPPDKSTLDFALFWKTWDTVSAKYFDKDKVVQSKMVYGAIRGMVASLGDPYTMFLEPQDNKVIEEDLSGSFSGVGIQIGYKEKQLAVIAPLPGSPSEKAGIKAGDYILKIIDEEKGVDADTSTLNLTEAVQLIRGPAKTKVKLTLFRDGDSKPFEKEVVRESINVPSVTVEYVGDKQNVAHLKVIKFSGDTSKEWEDAVAEILKKPEVNSLVVDVRNNPGGYLEAAVELAADFLDNGSVAVIQQNGDESKQEFKTTKMPRLKTYKTVVLINEGSASASEILAGALRDGKKYRLIGDNSFGKGTIQEPENLDNGAGLHITIAKWLTPNGTWVHEEGLKPDVEVEDKEDTEEDEQLQEAIKIVTSN